MLFNMSANQYFGIAVQRYYNFRRYANFVDKKQCFTFGMGSVSLRSSYFNLNKKHFFNFELLWSFLGSSLVYRWSFTRAR